MIDDHSRSTVFKDEHCRGNDLGPPDRDGQELLISFPALPEKNMLIPEIPVLLPVPVDIPVDVCHP